MPEVIGKKIALLRKQHKYTQNRLAELCGETAMAISAYERGQRMPPERTIERLAYALHTTPELLVDPNYVTAPTIEEFIANAPGQKPVDYRRLLEDMMINLTLSPDAFFDGRLISSEQRREIVHHLHQALLIAGRE